MALRLFMLLTLISGFWELIEEFMAASNGEGGNHMLLTLKMLCGLAVIAFMEISIAKRKQQTSHKFFLDYYYFNHNNNGYWCYFTLGSNFQNIWNKLKMLGYNNV